MPLKNKYGLRPDGTPKGIGFLGEQKLPNGGIATEYSIGTTDVTGKELDIPTLIPTLTQEELGLLLSDIIPNKGKIPNTIFQKVVAHAKKRISEDKSPFAGEGELVGLNPPQSFESQLFPEFSWPPIADPKDVQTGAFGGGNQNIKMDFLRLLLGLR